MRRSARVDDLAITGDPWLALAAAVVRQAIAEYRQADMVKALDAFCWLVWGGPALYGLSADDIFREVVQYGKVGRTGAA